MLRAVASAQSMEHAMAQTRPPKKITENYNAAPIFRPRHIDGFYTARPI
jgi:hypothetical protein